MSVGQGFPLNLASPYETLGNDLEINNKQYPGLILNPISSETNELYSAVREINGSTWIFQNADVNAAGPFQINSTVPSYAFTLLAGGGLAMYSAAAGSQPGFTWTRLFWVDKNGVLQSPVAPVATAVFNVKNYGATGNGVTDDTAAIQSAETAAETAGGGIVLFPNGQYKVSSTITIANSNIRWLGTSMRGSQLVSAAGVLAPTVVSVTSFGVEFEELTFSGNGIAGSPPANAPPVILFNGCQLTRVVRCQFINNTGLTVSYVNCVDSEISGSRFTNVGFNNGVQSDANRTPAISYDLNCNEGRVHHNYFDTCNYDGVDVFGNTGFDVSNNFFRNCSGAAVYVGPSAVGTRVAHNRITIVHSVGVGYGHGIHFNLCSQFACEGNIVSNCDNDGIRFTGTGDGSVIGNISYNNSQVTGNAGITFLGNNTGFNIRMSFIGNVCYDSQVTKTQTYGFHITNVGDGSQATEFTIVGNSFFGNVIQDILIQNSVLFSDSNVVRANSFWTDVQHTTPSDITGNSKQTLGTVTIPQGSMRQLSGIRMTAAGASSGATSNPEFFLSFGGQSILDYLATTHNGRWQLVFELFNVSATNVQNGMFQFYYNDALVLTGDISLTVDTTVDQPLLLQCNPGTGQFVSMKFMTVERL